MQAGYQANLHYYAGVTGRMRVVHWLEGSAGRLRDAPAGTVVSIITGRGNHTARGGRGAAQTRRAVLGLLVRHARVASRAASFGRKNLCVSEAVVGTINASRLRARTACTCITEVPINLVPQPSHPPSPVGGVDELTGT